MLAQSHRAAASGSALFGPIQETVCLPSGSFPGSRPPNGRGKRHLDGPHDPPGDALGRLENTAAELENTALQVA